jgi:sugar/nucleoside kinase (ribokinase family)
MKKYDAVIAGYTCVDMFPGFKKNESSASLSELFIPGKLIEIDGLDFILGGVVPNTGLAMKKFGRKVFLNGLIGDDIIGKMVKEWFVNYNLSEGIEIAENQGSGLSIIISPPGIDRIFLESPGCNNVFDTKFINYTAISQSHLFHFGYPPLLKQFYLNGGNQLCELFSEVDRMGVVTSLDFSLPDPETESGKIDWPELMRRVLPYTDIFAPSLDEALQIMDPSNFGEIKASLKEGESIEDIPIEMVRTLGKHIINSGVKILLLKMSYRGAYLLTGDISSINEKLGSRLSVNDWNNREILCNSYQVDNTKFMNNTGAGDTAIAAFLTAILNGEDPGSSLKYAVLAGRNNLYCTNIYEDLDSWEEMTDEIKKVSNELVYI